MSRVKDFDATGVAPGGKLYAGDLNAIQDHYADLSNFTQTHDVATLRVGDSSLQLIKYGTGEFRLTGALRTDGILRGLGGLYSGQFTTAGRPSAGSRPYGLAIFNTDTSRYEVNVGTDAAPNWLPVLLSPDVVQIPIGGSFEYAGSGDISATLVLEDGRELNRTTYATLFGLLSTNYGPGNGTTTFNIPDSRGRTSVGPDNMGTALGAANRIPNSNRALGQNGGEERHTSTLGETPAHAHAGSSVSNAGAIQTGGRSAGHTHGMSQSRGFYTFGTAGISATIVEIIGASGSYNTGVAMDQESSDHSHQLPAHGHGLTIGSEGGGSPHNNMQPYVVKNKIIRIA